MFPSNNVENEEIISDKNIISDNSKIYKTPDFNFEKKHIILKNGDINMIDDYQNVRNWIILFLRTPRGIYKIYEGTPFGTSLYLIRGHKSITGKEYAQIKSEIENGFKLNPNIKRVADVQLYRRDKALGVYVKCQLIDGYILEEKTEIFNIK